MADDDDMHAPARISLSCAVADLMAVGRFRDDDAAMRAALRAAVAGTRDSVDALWDAYRGGRPGKARAIRRAAR